MSAFRARRGASRHVAAPWLAAAALLAAPAAVFAQEGSADEHAAHGPPEAAETDEIGRGSDRRSWGPPPPAGLRSLRVGAESAPYSTISAAVAAAAPWDTVRVGPGVYEERLRIRKPLVLLGEGRPAIDGGGRSHVIEAEAPLVLAGFVVRGSGTRVDTEDAGLMVRGAPVRVEGNRFEDVFYGIYLKQAPGSLLRRNVVVGKPLPISRRGDGIRLWESPRTEIVANEVVGVRDVVVFFSDSLRVADNRIRSGRYGLHYMYSDHNRFLRNRFERNQVGAFIMYSREIELRDNVFAAAEGPGGMGLGLKDSDEVRATGNLFVQNAIGVHLDNSPTGRDAANRFRGNVWLRNGTAVWLFPSVSGNEFRANDFLGNERPAAVPGGAVEGQAGRNEWHGNHWDGYAGFDRDGDGVGDSPFVHARLADHLMSRHPELELFQLSPALRLMEVLGRFFPLLRPRPVVVDSAPRLRPLNLARWNEAPPVIGADADAEPGGPRWRSAALWILAGLGAAGAALALARIPRPIPAGGGA